jgi:hypothetical protein
LLVVLLVFVLLLPISTPRIYATDEVQYYAYVRSLYFDHDLDFSNEYQHFADEGMTNGDPAVYNALLRHRPDDPPRNPQTGMYRNLAPIGAALMWSPGFVLADVGVRLFNIAGFDIPADGYSKPYIWSVCFMSALYSLLGLLLCYRLARRFVPMFAAALATITVWLASPLVFYTYIAMPWAHATAFFLFSLFLWLWLHGWDGTLAERQAQRSLGMWALLGLVGGLMTITREQLGLFMLLPAVEGVFAYIHFLKGSKQGSSASQSTPAQTAYTRPAGSRMPAGSNMRDIAGRYSRERGLGHSRWQSTRQENWKSHIGHLLNGHLVFLVCLVVALLPQILTYQVLNGRPMPSTVVSGKLASSGGISPHFFDTLIHPEHGAFFWSPVLFIGLVGLAWLVRYDWLLATLLLLGFVAQTYLNGSFGTTWHLSRAFGFRRLIECTPIFIIGLALLVEYARTRTGIWPLLFGAGMLIYWNGGLVAQWTVVRPDLREGLIWNKMLYYQFVEVPVQVSSKLSDLLFHRCRLYRNKTC